MKWKIIDIYITKTKIKMTRYLSIFTSGSGIAKVTYDDSNKPVNLIENFSEFKGC